MQIKQIKESMATFKRAESHNEGGGTRSRRDRLRSGKISYATQSHCTEN